MKITYDLEFLPERKRAAGRKSEETLAVIAFLADGKKKNMCIEYDTPKDAKRKYDTLRNYRNSNKLQDVFDIYRIEEKIYIVKTKKPGRRTGTTNG